LGFGKSEIFFARGLDRFLRAAVDLPDGQIRHWMRLRCDELSSPGIHLKNASLERMDCWVKPGNDNP
jgi:hypothetical protein